MDFYKRLIDELLKNDIVPNMTLYHWDLPYELQNLGGWLNRDVAKWFGEYAEIIFKEFSDTVPLFATINEPIATYVGYACGAFAPGLKMCIRDRSIKWIRCQKNICKKRLAGWRKYQPD